MALYFRTFGRDDFRIDLQRGYNLFYRGAGNVLVSDDFEIEFNPPVYSEGCYVGKVFGSDCGDLPDRLYYLPADDDVFL